VGFVIEGTVLTASHGLWGASRLVANLGQDGNVELRVIGADLGADVAILQGTLPPALTGGAMAKKIPKLGEQVVAVRRREDGTLERSPGIVLSVSSHPTMGLQISTDCLAAPGYSGAPLVALDGSVVGVITNLAILKRGTVAEAAAPSVIDGIARYSEPVSVAAWNERVGLSRFSEVRDQFFGARTAALAGNLKESASLLHDVVSKCPQFWPAWYSLAVIGTQLQDGPLLESVLQEWKEVPVREDLRFLTEGWYWLMKEQPERARQALDRSLAVRRSVAALTYAGTAAHLVGKTQEGDALWAEATQIDPGNGELWQTRYSLAMREHRATDAIEAAHKWEEAVWSDEPVVALAKALAESHDIDGAVRTLEEHLHTFPQSAHIRAVEGWFVAQQGDAERAIQLLEEAHRLEGSNAGFAITLASLYARAGKYRLALDLLEPLGPTAEARAGALKTMISCYRALGDTERMDRALEQLKKVDPFEYNRLR
jgi:tetratricopeptide (TPR) repeat protein